jgi:hypothetical protein
VKRAPGEEVMHHLEGTSQAAQMDGLHVLVAEGLSLASQSTLRTKCMVPILNWFLKQLRSDPTVWITLASEAAVRVWMVHWRDTVAMPRDQGTEGDTVTQQILPVRTRPQGPFLQIAVYHALLGDLVIT